MSPSRRRAAVLMLRERPLRCLSGGRAGSPAGAAPRRRIDADRTVRVLDRIVAGRERSRMDNGPKLSANALRDWCRLGGSEACYIEPGSPWENPFVESFGGKVRDEVLAVEAFGSLLEAKP